MAVCQITEFQDAQNDNQIQVGKTINAIQNITYTTAASSVAMKEGTKFVRIISDAAVYLDFFGVAATASSVLLPANSVEYFGVEKGQVISCYDGSS